MGSLAEPCTDDIDPFMKTWMAACMPIRVLPPKPVRGSPKPAAEHRHGEAALTAVKTQDLGTAGKLCVEV